MDEFRSILKNKPRDEKEAHEIKKEIHLLLKKFLEPLEKEISILKRDCEHLNKKLQKRQCEKKEKVRKKQQLIQEYSVELAKLNLNPDCIPLSRLEEIIRYEQEKHEKVERLKKEISTLKSDIERIKNELKTALLAKP